MNTEIKRGTLVAHYGVAVEILFDGEVDRQVIRVKRNSGHVVGDRVEVAGELLTRLERQSELSRMDTRGGVHIVGANLDTLYIVVSCEPLPPPGFIDRATVAARATGLIPILVANKSDLDCFTSYEDSLRSVYTESLQIFAVSAESHQGLKSLRDYFSEGHRGIFVGPTGVGKSSILNSLLPELNLQTGEISKSKKRGRHTTTVSTLHTLPQGGELIDSPGFHDFGLVGLSALELAAFFPGFEKAAHQPCHFRDCKHREEPQCSVINMVAAKVIKEERYATYLQILAEVEATDSDPNYRERRHRRKKN